MFSPSNVRQRAAVLLQTPPPRKTIESGPSSPSSAASSPGRAALANPVNTPLTKQLVQREKEERVSQYFSTLAIWSVLLAILCIECFFLEGWVGRLAFFEFFPLTAVQSGEIALIMVCSLSFIVTAFCLIREMITKETMEEAQQTASQVPTGTSPVLAGLMEKLGTTSTTTSWLESHQFGTTPQRNRSINASAFSSSPTASFGSPSSLPYSSPQLSFNTSALQRASPGALAKSILEDGTLSSRAPFNARIPGRPATKMLNSIHTREQLERLLQADKENIFDESHHVGKGDSPFVAQSQSFYQAMLHLDGLDPRPYQLGKEAMESTTDSYDVIRDSTGALHLSPKAASPSRMASSLSSNGDEATRFRVELAAQRAPSVSPAGSGISPEARRRRASLSSPHRGGVVTRESESMERRRAEPLPLRLSELELIKAEQRMRLWLVYTIIRPVDEGIKGMNKLFETRFAPLHCRVGISSVEQLTAAMAAHPDLATDTSLPYMLPYLAVHTNQSYLVSRISALSSGSCMANFSWASGGPQPADDKASTPSTSSAPSMHCRLLPRPWSDALPTDTQLVLGLFAAYMDAKISATALLNDHPVEQPFSARYVVVTPAKPGIVQQTPGAFYINMTSLNPPALELVTISLDGTVAAIQSRNLFRTFVHFLAHACNANEGCIDRYSIADPSLNLDIVLTGDSS